MRLQLISLSGIKLDDDIYELMIPTSSGEIAIFPGHEPLVSVAVPGVVRVRRQQGDSDDTLDLYAISGGVIDVSPDKIRVLVDEADASDEIVESEAQEALERALALQENAKDRVELEKAHQLIDRQTSRLKVAELRRRHRRP